MAEKKAKQQDKDVYLTQKELAERWRVSEGTIKNIRDKGGISYFIPPHSSRVFYPKSEVLRVEKEQLVLKNKEITKQKKRSVTKREKPVISENSSTEWRI